MLGRSDDSEVFEPVVKFVFVDVVDLPSVRNGTVELFPDDNVEESHPSTEVTAEVAFTGDVTTVGSL